MNNSVQDTIHFRLTQAFALILPVFPRWSAILIALAFINWLIGSGFKGFAKSHFKVFPFFLFVGFFFLYLIGLLWSTNTESGLREIETKLSFVLMPLLYFTVPIEKTQLRKIVRAFIIGCAVAMIGWILFATYNFFITKYRIAQGEDIWDFGINFFLKDRLTIIVHPSYMAMYLSFAIWLIYKSEIPLFKNLSLKVFLYSLFILSILLLVSKAGIIVLILIGGFILFDMIRNKKAMKAISIFSVVILIFAGLFTFAPQFRYRFTSVIESLTSEKNVNTAEESTASRMAVWKASKEIISQKILTGTGTGGANDALLQTYKADNMLVALKDNLNAHNQYLQTFITLGIIGFLWLSIMLLYPMKLALTNHDSIYWGFLLILIINIFVESMFEAQAGVLFFAFFNALLFMNLSQKQKL